jgi:hypothetical protein
MVRLTLMIDLLAKVLIVCDENPVIFISFSNKIIVFGSSILVVYGKNFMTFTAKPSGELWSSTFVHEKSI